MSKQLKDYLPYYLGCEVSSMYGVSKLEAISYDGYCRLGQSITLYIDYIKPILRPLSDWSLRESFEYGVDISEMRSVIELGIYEPKLFHYLLSKHFDLFGLIDAGLAIDKTKQTQSHE